MVRKSVFVGFLFFLFLSFFSSKTFAHAGPPFVLINGDYSQTNSIALNSYSNIFKMGQDIATNSAAVNIPVRFDLDLNNFPTPVGSDPYAAPTQSAPAIHKWDFGDGTAEVTGKSVTHTYKKPGSYIINILVDYPGKTDSFVTVNTVQMNVLPSTHYAIPRPQLVINGVIIKDPSSEILSYASGKTYRFDASSSQGNNVSYQWDFGDGTKGNGSVIDHEYQGDTYTLLGVLRETDKNRVVVDTPFTFTKGSGKVLPTVSNNPFASFFDFIIKILHLS